MAAALEDTPVSYEDLADIERDFDDAETEIIRQQVALTAPLYEKRTKTLSQIPNFWPLVLEQAPPDIDQYIQPSDSALLLTSLTSLSVSHFELSPSSKISGDPRSVSIKFEFGENDYFEDKVLEKKFWHRRAKDGWSGLVSEPVGIKWKSAKKDLTGGLLGLVCAAYEAEKKNGATTNGKGKEKQQLSTEQKALKKKMDNTGMGGLSFFAWFGFIGRKVTAEESAEAAAIEEEKRKRMKEGKTVEPELKTVAEIEEEGEDDDFGMELEIFPDGDDLAVAIAEDLWPGAIKYFTQAQEQDALSDADFESDEDLDDLGAAALAEDSDSETDGDDDAGPPSKRVKSTT